MRQCPTSAAGGPTLALTQSTRPPTTPARVQRTLPGWKSRCSSRRSVDGGGPANTAKARSHIAGRPAPRRRAGRQQPVGRVRGDRRLVRRQRPGMHGRKHPGELAQVPVEIVRAPLDASVKPRHQHGGRSGLGTVGIDGDEPRRGHRDARDEVERLRLADRDVGLPGEPVGSDEAAQDERRARGSPARTSIAWTADDVRPRGRARGHGRSRAGGALAPPQGPARAGPAQRSGRPRAGDVPCGRSRAGPLPWRDQGLSGDGHLPRMWGGRCR
jgi:hypothetical protein